MESAVPNGCCAPPLCEPTDGGDMQNIRPCGRYGRFRQPPLRTPSLYSTPACSCSVPVRADQSFACSGFGMEWTREARDGPRNPGQPDVRLTQCRVGVEPWPTLPTSRKSAARARMHPSGVVDTVVLPAARSVTALTDAQPLRTRPGRAFVMAKGNLPSMSLLIPGLFRVSRCWGARARRGGLS